MSSAIEQTAHVLVVEDDPLVQRVLGLQLASRGHRVTIGGDGLEGLRAAERLRPDLVVLDLMLPRMDGFELLERLRAHVELAHIPVLVLTASLDQTHRAATLRGLADAYLTKPYSESELHEKIEALLRKA